MSPTSFNAHPVELPPPDISAWAASTTGIAYAHERVGAAPGPQVLITALVHGNEYAGAQALADFLKSGIAPGHGRITAVFCNTAAFARFDRAHPDASRCVDEDFNRVWAPATLDGERRSTELQRAREIRPLVERATHLLDLHSMHEPAPPLFVTGLLGRNVAMAQALCTDCQVVMDEGHADGVRMRDHGQFGEATSDRLALLLEAGQHWERSALDVARNVLMRFLVLAGALERAAVPPGWLLPDAAPPPPLQVTHRVVASSMDFEFTQDFRGGEVIARAGTLIARDAGVPVVTPYDNCVLVMPSLRQLRPGVTTVRLAQRSAHVVR